MVSFFDGGGRYKRPEWVALRLCIDESRYEHLAARRGFVRRRVSDACLVWSNTPLQVRCVMAMWGGEPVTATLDQRNHQTSAHLATGIRA